jgi:hypothetical protein
MQVRLSEIALAARHRLAPLTAEVAGYIVWLVTAEALTASRCVSAERIGVTLLGEVMLAAGEPEPALASERELRRLLGSLLGLCQASTPALRKASERVASGDLEALQAELGAALIPINHAASRRALARLYRETDRARAELVVPVVILDDAPAPSAGESALTQPSPLAADADGLEPGWETPLGSVLQRRDLGSGERPAALEVEFSDAALVFEPELRVGAPADDRAPPWIDVTACPEPVEAVADGALRSEPAPARSGTTLRSAVEAELLEIDVQFARDTERPAPGWPSEWRSDTPSPGTAHPETQPSAGNELSWDEPELDAFAAQSPETPPAESHRRTQPGLAPVAWLTDTSVFEAASEARAPSQTLRVTEPAPSGVTDRHRSDLGQLLSRFLSESGSDERITKDLRRMMGLELEAERLSEDEPPRAVGG